MISVILVFVAVYCALLGPLLFCMEMNRRFGGKWADAEMYATIWPYAMPFILLIGLEFS
jgi:hypothetical protein